MSISRIFVESMIKEWVFHKLEIPLSTTFSPLTGALRNSYIQYKYKKKAKCLGLKGIERRECYIGCFNGLINVHKKIMAIAKVKLKGDPKRLKKILKKNQLEINRLSDMIRDHKKYILQKKKKEARKEKKNK